ncbi:MAG: hypothetical protein SAMD01599839_20060 [Rectinema sp.]
MRGAAVSVPCIELVLVHNPSDPLMVDPCPFGYRKTPGHPFGPIAITQSKGLLTTEQFLAERKKEQGPRLTAMHAWLRGKHGQSPPSLSFGNAVSYALGQWERIEKYLEHELVTPDTNAIENAIRPFVIGRKNWLFSNTPLGAHASAGIYSLIETAKANGHEPYKYLCYLFNELPKAKSLEEKRALLPYRLASGIY